MHDYNLIATPMEKKLNLTSTKGSTFEDPTKYIQLVGSLNFLTTTRPNIAFVVGILSRFMHQPCEGHWNASKRVLKYLKGTRTYGIKYSKVADFHFTGYSDSNFDGDKENEVSTSCDFMRVGSTTISGRSRKEYVSLILPSKTNMLQQIKIQKKSFGFAIYLKIFRENKRLQIHYLLTTLLQFYNSVGQEYQVS